MRVTCDRCGQRRVFSETHAAGQRDMLIRDIVARMRHDGCGGLAAKAKLRTGIEGAVPARSLGEPVTDARGCGPQPASAAA